MSSPVHALQKVPADTQRVHQLLNKSDNLADGGQYEKAERLILQAEHLADSLEYSEGMQLVFASKANILLQQYKADSAEVLLKQGITRFPAGQKLDKLYNMLATAYRYKGENEQAILTYKKAISLIDSTKGAISLAGVKQNLGAVYYNMGSSAKAFQYYQQALNLAEQSQDSSLLAVVLNNIGDAYDNEEEYEKAEYYLQRSINISKTAGLKVNELRSIVNMGNTEKGRGNLDEALRYYHQAIKLSGKVRPDSPPVIILYNLGTLYAQKNNRNKAEDYFNKSLKYSRQGNIGPGLYYNSFGLGKLAEDRGNTSQAIAWYKKALREAQKLHSLSNEKEAREALYKVYKQYKNYSHALAQMEALQGISDSLNQRDYKQKLAEYKTRLELDRQNRINTLLSQRDKNQKEKLGTQRWLIIAAVIIILLFGVIAYIEYRAKKNKQKAMRLLREKKNELEELNEVKDRLFAILAHDLRGPLSAMQGMLYLLRNEDLSEKQLRAMLGDLEISMQHNLSIMENLLVWARQQLSGINIEETVLDANNMVDNIIAEHAFQAQQKEIEMVNKVPDDLRVKADPDLLCLILRNLITNGIKFSEEGDQITVGGRRKSTYAELEVVDTGIGISEDEQANLFKSDTKSRPGTKNEKGTGLGLKLCKGFVEELGGEFQFESEEGKGTRFYFTLPAA